MEQELRKYINTYHVEVFGDNGSWLDFVIAENEKIAIEKVINVYGKYHKNLKVNIKDNYDYYIS
jgi:hypothetical protein